MTILGRKIITIWETLSVLFFFKIGHMTSTLNGLESWQDHIPLYFDPWIHQRNDKHKLKSTLQLFAPFNLIQLPRYRSRNESWKPKMKLAFVFIIQRRMIQIMSMLPKRLWFQWAMFSGMHIIETKGTFKLENRCPTCIRRPTTECFGQNPLFRKFGNS